MMSVTLHFLSGLPRSGSTVLAALLNQHSQVHASPTSGLIDVMGAVCATWENNPAMAVQGRDKVELHRLLRSIAAAKYEHVTKPIVLDKSRGWPAPQIMTTLEATFGTPPRIIATVRDVAECAADFVHVVAPTDVEAFLRSSAPIEHLKSAYTTLREGYASAPDNFCIVDYDALVDAPLVQLERIHQFLGLDPFEYDLNAIDNAPVKENDKEVWGIPGLHDIGKKLERQYDLDARKVLGDLYDSFRQPAFWKGEKVEDRPPQLIDMQLEASRRGQFDEAWLMAQQLERDRPGDNRAAYNRGWFLMRQGKLQEGHRLLDRGRIEGVFGNSPPQSPAPQWDGRTPGTVLLNLEGGLGDQIHGVRYAKQIAERAGKCVIAGTGSLIRLLKDCPGVSAACAHEATAGVYHDAWVPAMSAPVVLGLEYEHLSGAPYIRRPTRMMGAGDGGPVIGLCWHGNLKFEKDHNKAFPLPPFWRSVRYRDVEYISLQQGADKDEMPAWVGQVPLGNWGETAAAIACCDLVITACTSVAHLAGAMGVPTWVVTPVLPYYLWALPGNQTPHYDSVRLFRQDVFGDWTAPMGRIAGGLAEFMNRRSRQLEDAA